MARPHRLVLLASNSSLASLQLITLPAGSRPCGRHQTSGLVWFGAVPTRLRPAHWSTVIGRKTVIRVGYHVTIEWATGLCPPASARTIVNMWQTKIYHEGLKAFRIIRAATKEDLDLKTQQQRAIWERSYQRSKMAEAKNLQRVLSWAGREEGQAFAATQTQQLRDEHERITTLLERALALDHREHWKRLKIDGSFADAAPENPLFLTIPPKPTLEWFRFKISLLDRLVPFLKNRKQRSSEEACRLRIQKWEQETLPARRENELRKRNYCQSLQDWKERKASFEREQIFGNEHLDRIRYGYISGDTTAFVDYLQNLFLDPDYPGSWPQDCTLNYLAESRTLVADLELPNLDAFPTIKEIRYVASRNEFKSVPVSESQRKKTYEEALYQLALAGLFKIFQSDEIDKIDFVVLNGRVRAINKATGEDIRPYILSVRVGKDEFLSFNLARVDVRACFKKLKGISASALAELVPVQPVLSINKDDARFVPGYEVAHALDGRSNLAAMDWKDFENLIREIFEKEFSHNGGEVKITQASRDGGVDAIAFDPDPIRGGKIVIQAKRYTNLVGVSAVRDLFGTVHNEGAMLGILVTTSTYGPDAYEFAKGKPLRLLNGSELLGLLERHGHTARIDLIEAKKLGISRARYASTDHDSIDICDPHS